MRTSVANACMQVAAAIERLRGEPNDQEIAELKQEIDTWSQTIREITQKRTFTFHLQNNATATVTLPEIMKPSEFGPPSLQNAKLIKLTEKCALYLVQKEQLRVLVPYVEDNDGLYHLDEPYLED